MEIQDDCTEYQVCVNEYIGKKMPPDAEGRVVHHIIIIDECSYSRMGFTALLKQALAPQRETEVTVANSLTDVSEIMWGKVYTKAVRYSLLLRLPASPVESLMRLFQLAEMPYLRDINQCVVLSSFNPMVIQRLLTIMKITNGRSLSDRGALPALCQTALSLWDNNVERNDVCLSAKHYLTLGEIKILQKTLQGISVNVMAYRETIKPKGMYARRATALRKCGMTSMLSLLRSLKKQCLLSDRSGN